MSFQKLSQSTLQLAPPITQPQRVRGNLFAVRGAEKRGQALCQMNQDSNL